MKKFITIFSLLFIVLFISTLNCFASEFPSKDIPYSNIEYTYKKSVIFTNSNGGTCLLVVASDYLEDINQHASIQINGNNLLVFYARAELDPRLLYVYTHWYSKTTGEWGPANYFEVSPDQELSFGSVNGLVVHESFTDIYYSNDPSKIFFKVPPTVEMTWEKKLQTTLLAEVPEAKTKVLGMMKTLLLCGVGCLALVISLPLFGKVFRRLGVR